MRIKSELWVKAYIRRCAAAGKWAVVARHGDPDAGTVFVRVDLLNGHARLFGPAPGAVYNEAGERQWAEILPDATAGDVQTYIDRRVAGDPDIWVVDLEDRDGDSLLVVGRE